MLSNLLQRLDEYHAVGHLKLVSRHEQCGVRRHLVAVNKGIGGVT